MEALMSLKEYSILWDITGKCNFACNHCTASEFISEASRELSLHEISKLIYNLKGDTIFNITFCGGEPLIREDLLQIIDLLQENLKIGRIALFTNGSYLRSYGRDLLRRNVYIKVSLDGVDKIQNDRIRGSKTFDLVVDNIRWIAAEKKGDSSLKGGIGLSYTVTGVNSKVPATDLWYFCKSLGADGLSVAPVFGNGKASLNKELLLSKEDIVKFTESTLVAQARSDLPISYDYIRPLFVKYINTKYSLNIAYKYHGCKALTSEFIIRPDGVLMPCRSLYPGMPAYRSLIEKNLDLVQNSLDTILQGESVQKIMKLKNPRRYPLYVPCNECEFAGGYCDPCWINAYLSEPLSVSLCSYAKKELEQ